MNSPWPKQGEARIAPYLFQTDAPLIQRSICAKAGLWREDDTYAAQEYEYFARIKFFSDKVIFIDRVLTVYSKHSNGQIYSPYSRKYTLSMLKLTLIVKGLLLYSKYDSNFERNILSKEFKEIGKRFYKMRDFKNADMALKESLLLSWSVRCFLQRCLIGTLSVFSTIVSKQYLSKKYFNLKLKTSSNGPAKKEISKYHEFNDSSKGLRSKRAYRR
jgi:hypothetical protein